MSIRGGVGRVDISVLRIGWVVRMFEWFSFFILLFFGFIFIFFVSRNVVSRL